MSLIFHQTTEPSAEACHPSEVALKSFFLGPQAENAPWLAAIILELLEQWFIWRRDYFPEDGGAISFEDRQQELFKIRQHEVRDLALQLMKRYESEVPKFSPRYIGHMFSEISMPALIGHVISLLHNPKIIASESAIVGVQIENEAIIELLKMVGFDPRNGLGHFTSGGSVANYEALLRAQERTSLWMARGLLAGNLDYFHAAHQGWSKFTATEAHSNEAEYQWTHANPWTLAPRFIEKTTQAFLGAVTLIPRSKHYSWLKAIRLLGLGDESCWQIPLNQQGRMSIPALREALHKAERDRRPILMVVSVAGTTEMGEVDGIDQVQELLDEWKSTKNIHIWHHVDGAYGAFFRTLEGASPEGLKPEVWAALHAIERVNSITIDPHKLGYVPYACGAILVREAQDYMVSSHDAPYIQYKALEDRGKFTLEGSRSAGGATATWLTAKSIGLHAQGYGMILARTLRIRRQIETNLKASGLHIQIAPEGDTNVLCLHAAREGEPLSLSNARSERLYKLFMEDPEHSFFVSKTILHSVDYSCYLESFTSQWRAQVDEDSLVMIRLCLMNPFFGSKAMTTDFHKAWIASVRSNLEACEQSG